MLSGMVFIGMFTVWILKDDQIKPFTVSECRIPANTTCVLVSKSSLDWQDLCGRASISGFNFGNQISMRKTNSTVPVWFLIDSGVSERSAGF